MDDVLKDARDRLQESQSGSEYNRDHWYEDVKFARMSEQWPDEVKDLREKEGRPCLTANKLAPLIRQIVNESRQNKPGISISPVDNGADVETAEVIGGLIRAIERGSDADVAYDTAIDHAVSGGFGFFRIGIDYAHPDSFNLEARIERIPNALMVHWDTASTAYDASDWRYAFVSEFVTKDELQSRYPDAQPVDFDGDTREVAEHWMQEDMTRLAEFWQRERQTRKIVQLSDGSVYRASALPDLARQVFAAGAINPQGYSDDELISGALQLTGLSVTREREAEFYEVKRRIISGVEVLEEQDWPGSKIPICPVWGDEVYFDGRRHFRSMIRDARDPQVMHNFWRSATTELVALAPRAPFIMGESALPEDEHERSKWETANTRSYAYLTVSESTGMPPQRQPMPSVPAGALQEAITANEDIQSITGIYPASIGARSNETSGRAILARERQANISNFHFLDNLNRAIRYCGECLVEIIPSVYSEREAVRILGEDMREKVVKLTTEDGGATQQGPDGGERLYNLSVGKYDVSVSSGPGFATQREETRETLIEIMRQVPDAAPIIGDVLMEHMDFQGADRVAKRLQAMLPPNIQAAEGLAPAPVPANAGSPDVPGTGPQ